MSLNTETENNTENVFYWDPKENGFFEYTDELLENISFKQEAIRTWEKWWVELSEILTNFWNTNIAKALNSLKSTNRTYDLFRKVIKFAFEEVSSKNKWVSVNLYLEDLSISTFQFDLEELVKTYNIDNSKITFEILETNYWNLNWQVLKNLFFLKERWFKIAIDDFIPNLEKDNTSYFILETLLKNDLVPEYVKIDWSYLQEILKWNKSNDEIRLIKSMIKNFKSMWIKIIWEWIQSNQDWINAKKLWIDLFQWRYIDDNFTTDEVVRDFKLVDNSKSFRFYNTLKSRISKQSEESIGLVVKKIKTFTKYTWNQVEDILAS